MIIMKTMVSEVKYSCILYGTSFFMLSQVNLSYVKQVEQGGLKFVGHDVDGERMEIIELEGELN